MKEFKSQKIKSVLKSLLKKKDITYEDLAAQMECSVPTIKRMLGAEELSLNRLLQLCEIVEIDLADLEALTKEEKSQNEKFTPEQEKFLAKNTNFFAYLMNLFDGKTPKQIAESNQLTQKSTDKYLIALEKLELIKVTGSQKVKPNFKNVPHLGNGPLGRTYADAFVHSGAKFFSKIIQESLNSHPEGEKVKAKFSLNGSKVTKASYEAWVQQQESSNLAFEKLCKFEEKTKPTEELVTVVIMQAHAPVENDYSGLKQLENSLATIVNIA
ncbi:MAG: helix-turn-helix transcriptional regulator [Bdellovibrio sp.]|nr:helix-turn-helix transcriptional regulator [Bdellovibrio sp.]